MFLFFRARVEIDIPRIGACGSNGQRDCFLKVVGSNPASRMPRKIRCVDIGKNRSKCTGEIVCFWIRGNYVIKIK